MKQNTFPYITAKVKKSVHIKFLTLISTFMHNKLHTVRYYIRCRRNQRGKFIFSTKLI